MRGGDAASELDRCNDGEPNVSHTMELLPQIHRDPSEESVLCCSHSVSTELVNLFSHVTKAIDPCYHVSRRIFRLALLTTRTTTFAFLPFLLCL